MKPILYPPEERGFNSNGLGVWSEAISCTVTWEGNGIFDLTMEYPMDGIHFDKISDRCIIMAIPTPYKDPQPFRIYDTIKNLNGTVTIYANHVAYDLEGVPVRAFSADSVASAMASIENNTVTPSGFTFWTNKTTAAQFSMDSPASVWKILGGSEGSILDVYGGEYEFDRWNVKLHDHLGQDNGVVIRYGKNMTDLEQERNLANLYTGVYPYWQSSDGKIVTCSQEVVPVDGTFDYTKIFTLDASAEFQDEPTPEQLKAYAEQYIKSNGIGKPKVSITVSHEMLEQTDEYSGLSLLERCSVFDTVTVQFERLGVNAKAKIASADTDVLLERYISLKVGSVRANIADTIARQQTELEKVPNTSDVQAIADRITQALLGAKGGSIRLLDTNGDGMPDTLYIADNPDPAKAVKVWRFNYEGWGASSNGYNGPFEMSAALGIGIYADYITTGTLSANLMRAGVLQDRTGKVFKLDLDAGTLDANFNSLKISGKTTEQIAAAKADNALSDAKNYTDGQLETVKGELSAEIEQTPSRIQLSVLRTGYFPVFEYINWTNYTAGTFGNKITLRSSGTTTARLLTTDPDTLSYARGNTLQGYLSYQIHTAIVGKASASYLRLSFVVIYADGTNTAQHILYADGQKTMAAVGPKTNAALNLAVADKEISQIYLEVLTNKCSGVIEVGEVWANVAELNGKASTLTLTADGAKISSANIVMRGAVSFEDLSGTGRTDINGSNIATGCLANHDRSALFDLDGKRFRMGTSSGERVFIDKSGIQWYGGTGTTGATAQGVIKNGLTTTSSGDTTVYGADTRYQKYGWYHDGNFQGITVEQVDNEVMVSGKLSVNQAVSCRTLKAWDAKERVVRTPLGSLQMNAMESPEPLFWDVGSGVCDSTGVCWIALRPEYAETISRRAALRWVVTPTGGAGNLWVEKLDSGALVHGGSGQRFDWMCAGVQRGFEGCYAEGDPGRYPVPENPGDWILTAAMDEAAVDLPLTI